MTDPHAASPLAPQPAPRFRAALFDFDGTLFDTDAMHLRCWQHALEQHGGRMTREDYFGVFVGKSTLAIAESLVQQQRLAIPGRQLADEKEEQVRDALAQAPAPWMPGADRAFHRFRAAGFKLAVVTSSRRDLIAGGLRHAGVLDHLAALVTREDVHNQKPDPECYRLCLERLALPPEACVVFEDTHAGVAAASAAGIPCVAVRPPHIGMQDFSAAVRAFPQLPDAADWILGA